jgi:hypothetical protein
LDNEKLDNERLGNEIVASAFAIPEAISQPCLVAQDCDILPPFLWRIACDVSMTDENFLANTRRMARSSRQA